jgi:SAM-dependent methyltransferase
MPRHHLHRLVALVFLATACARGKDPAVNERPVMPTASSSREPAEAAQGEETPVAQAEEGAQVARDDLDEDARSPDVHFVPTPQPVVDRMLELARVTRDDVLYDLGCGDGRIVVAAARKYGVRARGYDIDPQRVREARANVKKNGVEHLVTIEQADIFTLDLSGASVITLYLLPELNVRLIPQLQKLKKGSRIVSHDFDMEGVKSDKMETMALGPPDGSSHHIYLWTTPLRMRAKDMP